MAHIHDILTRDNPYEDQESDHPYTVIKNGDVMRFEEILDTISLAKDTLTSQDIEDDYVDLMFYAVREGNVRMVKALLMRRTCRAAQSVISSVVSDVRSGISADKPLLEGNCKIQIIQEFLNHGWDMNESNFMTPFITVATEDEAVLKWGLACGGDPNVVQPPRPFKDFIMTPTTIAATYETTSRLEMLLSNGALIDPQAIFDAMESGKENSLQILQFLAEHNVDFNKAGLYPWNTERTIPQDNYISPLHMAVYLNRKDYVELFLRNGAQPNLERFRDDTPAARAQAEGKTDLYEILTKGVGSK